MALSVALPFYSGPCSVLETSEELRAALVQGLDNLVAISYVDDDEVRCCGIVVVLLLHSWRVVGQLGTLCSVRGGSKTSR